MISHLGDAVVVAISKYAIFVALPSSNFGLVCASRWESFQHGAVVEFAFCFHVRSHKNVSMYIMGTQNNQVPTEPESKRIQDRQLCDNVGISYKSLQSTNLPLHRTINQADNFDILSKYWMDSDSAFSFVI